jgi:hypothetical protein
MPLFYSGQTDYVNKLNAMSEGTFSTAIAATVGGTTALSLSSGGSYFVTMGAGNTTLTFSSAPTTAFKFTVFIKQDGTGSRLVTWPSISWSSNDVVPTLTTTANRVDIFEFRTVDGGTTWYGTTVSLNHG